MNIKVLSFNEKIRLLKSNNISLEKLEELSDDKNINIRINVAKHKNCSLEILEKLSSNDEDLLVKYSCLANKNCPFSILEKLYKEFPNTVLAHSNCPDYLKALSK